MGAGAKSEAIRLVMSANELIRSVGGDQGAAEVDRERAARALDHGLSRRVDHRVRQSHVEAPKWFGLDADAVDGLVAEVPGMVVMLGSHPNGRVREAAVRLAGSWITPNGTDAETETTSTFRKPPVGVTGMLAQRSLDPTPQVRSVAIERVAELFEHEKNPAYRGKMPKAVERAAREVVAQTRAVAVCPQLVHAALDLFELRIGRYSVDGVRDHHQHTLSEVDRRAQVLDELRRLVPELTENNSITAAERLVDFYERSLRPVRADDEGAVLDADR